MAVIAYYNEIDPFKAMWLRQLIHEGHIAFGVVDERSIEDIRPDELAPFTQCHFFAGIGVWSYAARLAGWPDDRPIWTGSCPCQPFSAAGKSGGFADERHLWPAWHHLIRECRPDDVLGEQVASKDGLAWLDLVQADMEGTGYAGGALDICAASVGAPHIRQRQWLGFKRLANTNRLGQLKYTQRDCEPLSDGQEGSCRNDDGGCRDVGRVDDASRAGLEGQRGGPETAIGWGGTFRPITATGEFGGVANDTSSGRRPGRPNGDTSDRAYSVCLGTSEPRRRGPTDDPGAVNGVWRDADWLFCRDGKWRPVEPGTFPLAHGAPARVGRLRGYGDGIVAQVAAEVIAAYMELDQ